MGVFLGETSFGFYKGDQPEHHDLVGFCKKHSHINVAKGSNTSTLICIIIIIIIKRAGNSW